MSESIQFKSDSEFDVLFQPYSEEAKGFAMTVQD